MKKYTWDFDKNREIWRGDTFDTIDECILDARQYAKEYGLDNEDVYIGETVLFKPSVDAWGVLEQIMADAYEDCGEVAEDWEANDSDQEMQYLSESLTDVVNRYLARNNRIPNFYSIINIKKYDMLLYCGYKEARAKNYKMEDNYE